MNISKPKIIYKDSNFILFRYGAVGVTILNKIYINKNIYKSYGSDQQQAFIVHENVHVKQQTKRFYSPLVFFLLYFFSKKYRLKVELEASIEEIKCLYNYGYSLKKLIHNKAKSLSGKTYFYMASYESIYKKLAKFFNIL